MNSPDKLNIYLYDPYLEDQPIFEKEYRMIGFNLKYSNQSKMEHLEELLNVYKALIPLCTESIYRRQHSSSVFEGSSLPPEYKRLWLNVMFQILNRKQDLLREDIWEYRPFKKERILLFKEQYRFEKSKSKIFDYVLTIGPPLFQKRISFPIKTGDYVNKYFSEYLHNKAYLFKKGNDWNVSIEFFKHVSVA